VVKRCCGCRSRGALNVESYKAWRRKLQRFVNASFGGFFLPPPVASLSNRHLETWSWLHKDKCNDTTQRQELNELITGISQSGVNHAQYLRM